MHHMSLLLAVRRTRHNHKGDFKKQGVLVVSKTRNNLANRPLMRPQRGSSALRYGPQHISDSSADSHAYVEPQN
jgi:hypothetical protein